MIFILSLFSAFLIYYGIREFLWRSGVVPAIQRILNNAEYKDTFYEMYRIIYIQVTMILAGAMFVIWAFTSDFDIVYLKLISGFALLGSWLWIKQGK